ncbi:MAG: SUF system NifU family Fe-S cluster assembly protein [Bifidobacteriaceae bacterium]|jgi:nitrogen fixation NifU-like protein|nr:SUF system NifU family Fe-S cluster assembly protein [Bifidobacteriaceae bacterium]
MADYGLAGDDLEQMYQEFILEASRDPHGKADFAQDVSVENGGSSDSGIVGADGVIDADKRDANHAELAHSVRAEASAAQAHEACIMAQSHQFNPTCGDEVTVRVNLTDGTDGNPNTIESLVWDGHGCSISQASLSVMTDMVEGKTVDEFTDLSDTFHKLMNSRGKGLDDEAAEDKLDDAMAFQGVSKYPMRIKCALLGWAAVKDSIAQALTRMPTNTAATSVTKEA